MSSSWGSRSDERPLSDSSMNPLSAAAPARKVERPAPVEKVQELLRAEPPRIGEQLVRVLYVTKSIAEFGYHESLVRHLCDRGHEVRVLFDRHYSDGRSDRAVRAFRSEEGELIEGWAIRATSWQRRLRTFLQELATFGSYLSRPEQSRFYIDRFEAGFSRWVRPLLKPAFARGLLRLRPTHRKLLQMAAAVPPDPKVLRHVREISPDVVVASPANMRNSFEAEYLKAAESLGVRTVVPVFSWDNLTTKSLFPVLPDLLLAWNEAQALEAEEVHRIPEGRIEVVGAPLFDRWMDPEVPHRSRREFCERVGLDPERPFICYLGSTSGIAEDETWLVREIAQALAEHANPEVREVAMVVRPHPLHSDIYESLDEPPVRVWPRGGDMPDSLEALRDFHDTLRFSIGAFGINTTGMLDAVVLDRPCVAVMGERYRRTQEQALHFQQLRRGGVLEEVHGGAGCAAVVERLLRGEDHKRNNRRRFLSEFVRPHGPDRRAGEVAALRVEELALLGRQRA